MKYLTTKKTHHSPLCVYDYYEDEGIIVVIDRKKGERKEEITDPKRVNFLLDLFGSS